MVEQKGDIRVKVEANFKDSDWLNIKRLLEYLEKNPLGLVFTITIGDSFDV